MTTTPAMPAPICYAAINKQGDVTSTHKTRDSWRTVPLYALAALQAQPAEVSDAEIYALWVEHCETTEKTTRQLVCDFARAILALRPQSESEQEKELRRSLAEAQATISERNAEIIELQKRIRRSPQAVPMTDEQRQRVFAAAEHRTLAFDNVSWRDAIVDEVEAHHGITAPAGGEG